MQSGKQIHIGFAAFDQRFTFWAIVTQAVKDLAAEQHIGLSIIPISGSMSTATIIEMFVQQGVNAIITMPDFDSLEFVQAVKRALADNIRVIVLDSNVSEIVDTYHVRPDNFKGAMLAAEHLIGQLGGRGNLVYLQGTDYSHSAIVRAQAVHAVVARYPETLIIYENSGDWLRQSGKQLMAEALSKHTTIDGVICGNDLMALGALDAISAAADCGNILVAGFDAQAEALRAISSGSMCATVWQNPGQLGRVALELALRVLVEPDAPREIIIDTTLVTTENLLEVTLQTIDLLPSVLQDLVVSTEAQQRLQQDMIAAQQSLIRELSTPVIPITDEIVVIPLIGTIDTNRAQQIMKSMLDAISQSRAQALILDVTGVAVIDTNTANYLVQAARAVQLLGAHVILVGIAPEIAQTIVQLGIDLSSLITQSTLQSGLEYALTHLVHGQKSRKLYEHYRSGL